MLYIFVSVDFLTAVGGKLVFYFYCLNELFLETILFLFLIDVLVCKVCRCLHLVFSTNFLRNHFKKLCCLILDIKLQEILQHVIIVSNF